MATHDTDRKQHIGTEQTGIMLQPLTANSLSQASGIRHGFFTRQGGVSEGIYQSLNAGQGSNDNPESVARNRAIISEQIGTTPDRLLTLYQIHSADCLSVSKPWSGDLPSDLTGDLPGDLTGDRPGPRPGPRPKADAMVTSQATLALGVLTADCGPVLFADPHARIVGAAHAGWKGAVSGVLENTISAMEDFGARRANIMAVIGPTIRQPNYEVGPEFVDRLITISFANDRYFVPSHKPDHAMFDLPGYIADKLNAAGIVDVDDLGLCTYADEDRFFSYRRATHRQEADYGRLISVVMLSDQ